jgi:hypothetical protein
MNQSILLTPSDISQKTVWLENIKATFTEQEENTYDVTLEINSNKFLISIQHIADEIQQLEIIAVK